MADTDDYLHALYERMEGGNAVQAYISQTPGGKKLLDEAIEKAREATDSFLGLDAGDPEFEAKARRIWLLGQYPFMLLKHIDSIMREAEAAAQAYGDHQERRQQTYND